MSVHPPRETKTRRGADRRALGGRRASPCGGALVPLWGQSFPSWDFGVSAAAFAAAPRQHKPPSEETVERQDSDEAQTKGKNRLVKFITIRGMEHACEVVYSDLANVKAKLAVAAPAGEYTLKVYTRSGLGDAFGVKVASRKVTVV